MRRKKNFAQRNKVFTVAAKGNGISGNKRPAIEPTEWCVHSPPQNCRKIAKGEEPLRPSPLPGLLITSLCCLPEMNPLARLPHLIVLLLIHCVSAAVEDGMPPFPLCHGCICCEFTFCLRFPSIGSRNF